MKKYSFLFVIVLASLSLWLGINASQPSTSPHIKNIILLIGDGMGPSHLGLLETYLHFSNPDHPHTSAFSRLAKESSNHLSLTHPYQALVVDSACSASQLATGKPCLSETLGLDHDQQPALTILERAKRLGKSTGLVSDTRITHATPAAFAAHQKHRSLESEVAQDLINNQVDVLLSGGLSFFLPQDHTQLSPAVQQQIQQAGLTLSSKRTDQHNLLFQAHTQGYQLALTAQELHNTEVLPVLGLFQNSVMPDAISIQQNQQRPTLKQMTEKALSLLEKNEQGFFLMVEAGQIDWTAHNNDAGALLHELLQFDDVLNSVLSWVETRNDTLLIVTADHETGGFGFSYHQQQQPDLKQQVPLDFVSPDVLKQLYQQSKGSYAILADTYQYSDQLSEQASYFAQEVKQHLSITLTTEQATAILSSDFSDYDPFYVYHAEKPLNKLAAFIAKERGIVWSTGTHTAAPVPVFIRYPNTPIKIPRLRGILTHPQLGEFMHELWKP